MDYLIIAHRGESIDAPENTLASVNLAWERGAGAVEIDVHLSYDNRIVVIHDPTTKRTGGLNKKVKFQKVDELKLLDVGGWKSSKYRNERIPTLIEVINTVPPEKKLVVEIKSGIKLVSYLKNEIDLTRIDNKQIEIISFDFATVKLAKRLMPTNKVLYLAELDYTWLSRVVSPSVDKLIFKVKNAGLDGLNVWAGKKLNEEFVHKVKNAGLLLYVWTVNDPEHAKMLISWGVDAITTDVAQWMRKRIEQEI
jgi:glycerophosphoryl diester phosphodiesterase